MIPNRLTDVNRGAIIDQYMSMLRNLRFFFKDPFVISSVCGVFLFTLIQLIVLLLNIAPKPEPIFLHYTTYFGVDFIGAWYLAYGIPVASLMVGIINMGLGYMLMRREKVLGYVLMIGSTLIGALLLIVAFLVVRLNS